MLSKGFLAALLYGVVSVVITFANKAVFQLGFHASNTLTLSQIVFSLIFLSMTKHLGYTSFPDFSWSTAKKLSLLVLSFCGMVVTGLAALRFVNIPMYSALRRVTTWVVIIVQESVMRKQVDRKEKWAVYVMVLGALIAGWGDVTFHLMGYILIGLNCLVTAMYLVIIAKKQTDTKMNSMGLMFYNNLMALPLLLVMVLAFEWEEVVNFERWGDPWFLFVFCASSVMAFLLNYAIFLCSIVNSPLTTSVTGQLKNILSTALGLFVFGDVKISFLLLVGLFLSSFASVWYATVKYEQSMAKKGHAPQKSPTKTFGVGTPTSKTSTL